MKVKDFLEQSPSHYADWFGEGDSLTDYNSVVKDHGEPLEVLQNEFMLSLVYNDKIVVIGYDGNEYQHSWIFTR